jgi:hypothetical protein
MSEKKKIDKVVKSDKDKKSEKPKDEDELKKRRTPYDKKKYITK